MLNRNLIGICFLLIFTLFACKKDPIIDPCATVQCDNGGQCESGTCDCPEGFSGTNCEIEDLCITGNINCENGGECENGACICPTGYTGENCELIDPSQIQYLLDEGLFTPLQLVEAGVPLEELYGRTYAGGLLFYIDVDDRLPDAEGMVTAMEDQSDNADMECENINNPDLDNTSYSNANPGNFNEGGFLGDGKSNTDKILGFCDSADDTAAQMCRNLGPEWFLPSMEELYILSMNIPYELSLSSSFDYYWSSSEESDFAQWAINAGDRFDQVGKGSSFVRVRAMKEF